MNLSPRDQVARKQERREELAKHVKGAQLADSDAFEAIVRLTEDHARKLAYSIVGPDHCEDVLQESYLLVFRKIAQVKRPEAFMGWLCRLVMHVAYRYNKKYPETDELPTIADAKDGSSALLDSLVLRAALKELKKKDQELLVLRELLSFSYEEIAQVLEIPVGTVRSRLHKARARLSTQLSRREAKHSP